jgi:hypothetical protein
VENARDELEAVKRKRDDLESLSREYSQGDADFPSDAAKDKLAKCGISDPANIEQALKDVLEFIPVHEMAIVRAEKALDDTIVKQLDKLEALEINRLETQQKAIRHSATAEKNFFTTLHQDSLKLREAIEVVDAASDMEQFLGVFTTKMAHFQAALAPSAVV